MDEENLKEENLEEENYEENSRGIDYKIVEGKIYTINRQDHNGKAFYKITVKKKNKDGTTTYGNKNIFFRKDVELQDKTKIKINKAMEDFWNKDKYTTIFSLVVLDFEVVSQPEEAINKAYEDFNNNDDFDLPF